MIRILIAEDSGVVTALLENIFEAEPDMRVIGHARNGREAVRMAGDLKPDLVTMDIRMPVMDGVEATCSIMTANPVPIVVVSSAVENEEVNTSFRALKEGALAVIEKPRGFKHQDFERIRSELVTTVRAMAEVKVVTRRARSTVEPPRAVVGRGGREASQDHEIVGICCSTGGPQALQAIFSAMPGNLGVPVVTVQHMAQGFLGGLVQWLGEKTPLDVKLAEDGETLIRDTVYFAPDDRHLVVRRDTGGLRVRLSGDPRVNGFRPAGTVLLRSLAETCRERGVGVVLTGMGEDGAEGLLELYRAGGHTVIQDEASSIIYGMPRAALKLGGVERIVDLEGMAGYLTRLLARSSHENRRETPRFV